MSEKFWPHLFRALGQNFPYDARDHDILAVSDYVKVNPRTLEKYIRHSYEKYRAVWADTTVKHDVELDKLPTPAGY